MNQLINNMFEWIKNLIMEEKPPVQDAPATPSIMDGAIKSLPGEVGGWSLSFVEDDTYPIQPIGKTLEEHEATPPLVVKPFVVKSLVNALPWHPDRSWSKRALTKVDKVIVHQSLSSRENTTFKGINNYHITPSPDNHISPNGAPHICYHYGIDAEGTAFQFNPLSASVWHTRGQNTVGIGIVLLGDFTGPSYTGKDLKPTRPQLVALEQLLEKLQGHKKLNITKQDVFGHSDFGKENCPGSVVDTFIKTYRNA